MLSEIILMCTAMGCTCDFVDLWLCSAVFRAVTWGGAGGPGPPRFFAKGKEFGKTINKTKKKQMN